MKNTFKILAKCIAFIGLVGILWLYISKGHEAFASTGVSISCASGSINVSGTTSTALQVSLQSGSIDINGSTGWTSDTGCSPTGKYTAVNASGVSSGTIAFSTDGSSGITFVGNGTSSNLTFTDTSASSGDILNLVSSPTSVAPDKATVNNLPVLSFYGITGAIQAGSGKTNAIDMSPSMAATVTVSGSGVSIAAENFTGFTTLSGGGTSANASTNTLSLPTSSAVTLGTSTATVTVSTTPYTFSNFETVTDTSGGSLTASYSAGLALGVSLSGVSVGYSPAENFTGFTTLSGGGGTNNKIIVDNLTVQLSATPGSGTVTLGPTSTVSFSGFLQIVLNGSGSTDALSLPSGYAGTLSVGATGTASLSITSATPAITISISQYGTIEGNSSIAVDLPDLGAATLNADYATSAMSLNTTFALTLTGFTSFSAPTSGTVAFSTDGSSPVVFVGNGASSSLALTGSSTLNLILSTAPGTGSVELGSNQVLSYSDVLGVYTGNSSDILTSPNSASTFTLTGTDSVGVTLNVSGTSLGTVIGIFSLSAGAPNSIFMADSTPGYSFTGDSGSTLNFSNASAGVTFCMGSSGIVNLSGYGCSSTTSKDSFTGITSLVGTNYDDNFIVGPGTWSINGGLGVNTVSFQNASVSTGGLIVNLEPGATTQVSGLASGTEVTSISNVSNVIGANAPTTIYEGTGSEYLMGGGGATIFYLTPYNGTAVINGGGGDMTINLSLAKSPTSLNLSNSDFQEVGGNLGEVMIVASPVENIVGSVYGGIEVGGSGSGTISLNTATSTSSDYASAGTGNYTVDASGAIGNETLVAGNGNNVLIGGAGNNFFAPGSGQLTLKSSENGTNWLDFADSPTSVDVNLSSSSTAVTPPSGGAPVQVKAGITGGWLQSGVTETISISINNVIGTKFSDIIVANNNNDNIFAAGSALIIPGTGDNNIVCASGSSCTVDYQNMPIDTSSDAKSGDGITLNANGTVDKWGVGGANNPAIDTLSGVSTIVSTESGNDILIASSADQTLIALNGKDLLQASSAGHDMLIGGNGQTTFEAGVPVAGTQYYTGVGYDTMIGGTGTAYYFTWIVNTPGDPTAVTPNNDVVITGGGASTLYVDSSTQVSGPNNQPLTGLNSIEEVLTGFAQNGQQIIKYPLEPESG